MPQATNVPFTITDIQQFPIGPFVAVDRRGNPTPAAGPFTVKADDVTLSVADNGDGTHTVKALGPLGLSQVIVTDGVGTGILDVTVVGSVEAGITIPTGSAVDQP